MSKAEVIQAVKELGKSKWFYSRMYEALSVMPDELMADFYKEAEKFNDVVDLVLFIES